MEFNDEEIGNIDKELDGIHNDKAAFSKLMENYKTSLAQSLVFGTMGNDLSDVLNGKKKIKADRWKNIKYKMNKIMDKIFNTL